jgi:LysR family positive regulator for ilvC
VAVVPEPDTTPGELRFVRLAFTERSLVAPTTDKELARRAAQGGSAWRGLPVILPRRGLDRERIDAWFHARSAEPEIYAEVEGNEAILAMVALGCGVGIVPELVRKESTLRGRIEAVEVARPPRGYYVSLCAKEKTLARRTTAALWELAPASASV